VNEYLAETPYFNFSHPAITAQIEALDLEGLDQKEQAIKLFYHVRDSIKYSIKGVSIRPEVFKAGNTISQPHSFCIPKAILLSTMARSLGIPARIHFVDFVNHRLSPALTEVWGTNVMATHCYSELYLNDTWVKATPALDRRTSEEHGFVLVEFDGEHDALLPSHDKQGRLHAEYVKDHGTRAELDLNWVKEVWKATYSEMDDKILDQFFPSEVETFA